MPWVRWSEEKACERIPVSMRNCRRSKLDGAGPDGLAHPDARPTFRHSQVRTRAWSNREANIAPFTTARNRAPHASARASTGGADAFGIHGAARDRREASVY